MTDSRRAKPACDWTVSGMDCGSCATKIKDAVARLPGVSGVEVGIMSERLRLTLDEAQTGRDKIEKTVRALGYEIAPRAAAAKKEFVMPGGRRTRRRRMEHEHSATITHEAAAASESATIPVTAAPAMCMTTPPIAASAGIRPARASW